MMQHAGRYQLCNAGTGHIHHNKDLDNLTGDDIERLLVVVELLR